MLVYIRVESTDVQNTMKPCVEKVIDYMKSNERADSVRQRDVLGSPLHIAAVPRKADYVIGEKHSCELVEGNEELILEGEFV